MTKHAGGIKILKTLENAGFEAFFVGGYVRDLALGRDTHDIDITTNATPSDIETLFDRTIPTGKAYGTMTVLIKDYSYEVTTYREDERYDNHRKPSSLRFGKDLKSDIARRDFTINQLTMDASGQVYDFYEGRRDLKRKVIRCIGKAEVRFEEDALRMLRAFRFSAQLDFTVTEETLDAINVKADLIREIAIERVQQELFKILNAPYKNHAINLMVEAKFAKALYSLEEGFKVLAKTHLDYDYLEGLTVLFLESGYEADVWRLSKKEMHTIKTLTRIVMQTLDQAFTAELLFTEGLTACLSANRIHRMYGRENQEETIKALDESLALRDVCELAFKGENIVNELKPHKPYYTRFILDHLLIEVLNKRINNEYKQLKEEALRYLRKLEKSE